MKKALDWKAVGQFVSVLVNLFTIARDTLASLGVDLAFIGWLCEAGKESFVKTLTSLGQEYLATWTHLIDLDADPFIPEGWRVEEHQKGGVLKWDPAKIALYLDKGQQNGKVIRGHNLRLALKNQRVLSTNLLDFLLKHPWLIPEEWKSKAVFFWGTIYRGRDGSLFVRCLCWGGGRWGCGYSWLDTGWGEVNPAAVRVA